MDVEEVPNPKPTGGFGVYFTEVSVQKLEEELAKLMKTADQLFSRAYVQANMQEMNLAEIELWLTLTAEGFVNLGVTGGNLAGTRSIVLRFRQK